MKNHLIDITITTESLAGMTNAAATLKTEITTFGINLDESQRKHSQKIGTRNETFAREMLEFARQHPDLRLGGIDFAAIERDLIARDQITPVLFELRSLTRTLEDTHTALGIDLFNGTRGLYKTVKPIALISGVQDIISYIGRRFARPSRSAAPATPGSTESAAL